VAELVTAHVDVIYASGVTAIRAAQQATATIPILGVADNMVGSELRASLPAALVDLNYLVDTENAVIVDVEPTPARTYGKRDSNKITARSPAAVGPIEGVDGIRSRLLA
jgi:hypothetical protein